MLKLSIMPVILKTDNVRCELAKNDDLGHTRCALCGIRPYSFCRCLNEDELKVFSKISSERMFSDKQNIFLQQEKSKNLYNVTEGNIKIYQLLTDGRLQIIGFLYPGDFFGSYRQGRYNYSAQAIGNVKVCVFNEATLNRHLEKNPKLSRELLNITANELTLAQDRIRVLGKLTATERMANFILNISDQRARIKWQDNPVSLPMNRQDIADYLGLTIATVSREITRLKTSNIIKVLSASQIYINDRTKLSLLCN
jgi:CRP/FNR family transcriptional regulator